MRFVAMLVVAGCIFWTAFDNGTYAESDRATVRAAEIPRRLMVDPGPGGVDAIAGRLPSAFIGHHACVVIRLTGEAALADQ